MTHDYEPALREGDRVRVYGTQPSWSPVAGSPGNGGARDLDTPEGERVLAVSGRLARPH